MKLKKLRYQVIIILFFGLLAFFTRALNLITPLGGVFVLDLRDFFVAIGAVIGGPVAGFIIGLMAGLPAAIPTIDVAAFSIAGLTTGYFSNYFYRRQINVAFSAAFMLTGYAIALVLIYYYDLWQFSIGLIIRAVICTPINIFILHNLLTAYPKILTIARFEDKDAGSTEEGV